MVLDAAAGQAVADRLGDGLGHLLRRIAISVLQVAADRQVDGGGDAAAVCQHVGAGYAVVVVGAAVAVVDAAAGGAERREARRGQDARCAGVPGIGHEKQAVALVQLTEPGSLGEEVVGHLKSPYSDQYRNGAPAQWKLRDG